LGVCGKQPGVAALQDLLVMAAKGLGTITHRLKALGVSDREANIFIIEALFTTVTNVNFDGDRLVQVIRKAWDQGVRLKARYTEACAAAGQEPEAFCCDDFTLADTLDGLVEQGYQCGIEDRKARLGEDVAGLQELILYGLKGAAAYADHAQALGVADDEVFAGFNEMLAFLAGDPTDVGELTGAAL